MIFKDYWILLFIPLAAIAIFLFERMFNKHPGFKFSSSDILSQMRQGFRVRAGKYVYILRIAAISLVLTALARPQLPIGETEITQEGIDIVLVIDVSTSMLAEDFQLRGRRVNRLEAVRDVVKGFIEGRRYDKMGIVVFALRPYTVAPMTIDNEWLLQNLERVQIGMVEDATAIGSGISAALNRMKDDKVKSKVIILLTDGMNNAGRISPLTAAEMAKTLGVKIYTIGAGTMGVAPYPQKDRFGNTVYVPINVEIDEDTLRQISDKTGGRYFRAVNTESLREIYQEIDKLEKTEIHEKGYYEYKELFYYFLLPGIIVLLLEIFLNQTLFRRIP